MVSLLDTQNLGHLIQHVHWCQKNDRQVSVPGAPHKCPTTILARGCWSLKRKKAYSTERCVTSVDRTHILLLSTHLGIGFGVVCISEHLIKLINTWGEAITTNFKVFGLTRRGIEPHNLPISRRMLYHLAYNAAGVRVE